MTMAAGPTLDGDHFQPARDGFEDLVRWATGPDAPEDHADMEDGIELRGVEVLRRVLQGRLDQLGARERADAAGDPGAEATNRRTGRRQIESKFGRVQARRLGVKVGGQPLRHHPLDERLNLPAGMYSHPLQRRVAEEARSGCWDEAVRDVDRTTGGHVPKRQAEEIAVEIARDFEAFYEQRPVNDTLGSKELLMASSDCKGVRVLRRALREATRKAAEAEEAEATRGDPMAKKKPSVHDKRMAIVAAVWQQQAEPRAAADIVSELRRTPKKKRRLKAPPRPKPQNKRVWASVEKSLSTGVSEMFDELDRRDPERTRHVPVLVDGEENQQTAILAQAAKRGRTVTIVLDIIHVIHYLWLAGSALCHRKHKATDVWVAVHLLQLLSSPVAELIVAIEQEQAKKRLTAAEKKQIAKALRYLRRNAGFVDYPSYLAKGLPIASGVIEGACRHLVQDRLGITGARWDLPGAEAMLRLRALNSSGDWDAYWVFHRQRDHVRNYAAAA